jgi:nucleotide sugar dehydrogenase
MTVCVVGLGKIGLPLALQIAVAGRKVIGADRDPRVVQAVLESREPFPGEPGLAERLTETVEGGRLSATTDTSAAVAQSEVVIVVVPLVIGAAFTPDFTALDAATSDVARGLTPGTLVSYETTLPLGTTRKRLAPKLAEESGLELGRQFSVCHSPERVSSGRVFADLRRYPKIVGGLDKTGGDRATEFYASVLQFDERPDLSRPNGVWNLGSAEAAELAKLSETTYRNLNIAFANEMAVLADRAGIDLNEVIMASNSQPYSHIHQPGIAVGGHCIPVYPHFVLSGFPDARLVKLALDVNEKMPDYAVGLLSDMLEGLEGVNVAVLGAAYRGGVKEVAFSGVFPVVDSLRARGATVTVHDPLFSDDELRQLGLEPHHRGSASDGAVVQSDHEEYRAWTSDDLPGVRAVLDGRGVLDPDRWKGVRLRRIGGGHEMLS